MADTVVTQAKYGLPQRFQEVASGEYAPEVYIHTGATAAVSKGRFFVASTGRLQLTVAGNVRCLLQNPVNSGKNLVVVRIGGLTTATGWAPVYEDPTSGLPTTTRRVNNAVFGHPNPASGTFKADINSSTPLGGGTDTELTIPMSANEPFELPCPPYILPPGKSIGVNIPFTGSADCSFTVAWFEE